MFLLMELLLVQLSQDDIFRITSVWLKMSGHSHSWALVLEVYHVLCSCSDVNWTSTQLWKVMATKISSYVTKLLATIVNYTGRSTNWCFTFINNINTSSKAYRGIWMYLWIIYLALKPIRRSVDETRDIVVTVSRMEQIRIHFKNFLRTIWKWRIWIRPFEFFEPMLNESMIYYKCFVWFEGLVMLSSKRGLNCGTPPAVWKTCVCLDICCKISGRR